MPPKHLASYPSVPSARTQPLTYLKPILPEEAAIPSARLWLAISLPLFPLEVALRGSECEKPCVMIDAAASRPRVLFANAAATRLGIRTDLPLAAARALGDCVVLARDTKAEQQALQQLAMWTYQFSPLINVLPHAGLVLEIQGSLKLFGGAEKLLARIRRELRELGYRGYVAAAPTPSAAMALANARQQVVADRKTLASALHELPLEVLSLAPTQLQDLYAIGLRTLGDCVRLPRAGLMRRFTPQMLLLLDRLYGRQPDPRAYFELPKIFTSRVELPWEVQHTQALHTAMLRLLRELTGYLRAQDAVTRELRWHLYQSDNSVCTLTLGVGSGSNDCEQLSVLTRERLHRETLSAPIRALELVVTKIARITTPPARDLFQPIQQTASEDWPQFVARLQARLGERALRSMTVRLEHRPEHSTVWRDPIAVSATARDTRKLLPSSGRRPLWLARQPIPLATHNGKLAWNSELVLNRERERIQSGWWDEHAIARDYFVATDQQGAQWWVYKDLTGGCGWYLHGVFE